MQIKKDGPDSVSITVNSISLKMAFWADIKIKIIAKRQTAMMNL